MKSLVIMGFCISSMTFQVWASENLADKKESIVAAKKEVSKETDADLYAELPDCMDKLISDVERIKLKEDFLNSELNEIFKEKRNQFLQIIENAKTEKDFIVQAYKLIDDLAKDPNFEGFPSWSSYGKESSQTKDRKVSEKSTIVETVAKDGARVSVEVISLEGAIFKLTGSGFNSNESLNYGSHSYDENICYPITADENGKIPYMMILPAVRGKLGGVCHINIIRKEEIIHIKLPWGKEPLKSKSVSN